MLKKEFVEQIAKAGGMSKADAERSLDAVVSALQFAIAKADGVRLAGLGTFKIGKREARKARNPITGATINVPASKTVRLVVSSDLKAMLNTKKSKA